MNILVNKANDGGTTYLVIRSISKKAPIVCESGVRRQELIRLGKSICSRMYPGDKVSMPEPVTYSELETGKINPSYSYIFEDLDGYFKYRKINIDLAYIEC